MSNPQATPIPTNPQLSELHSLLHTLYWQSVVYADTLKRTDPMLAAQFMDSAATSLKGMRIVRAMRTAL